MYFFFLTANAVNAPLTRLLLTRSPSDLIQEKWVVSAEKVRLLHVLIFLIFREILFIDIL